MGIEYITACDIVQKIPHTQNPYQEKQVIVLFLPYGKKKKRKERRHLGFSFTCLIIKYHLNY